MLCIVQRTRAGCRVPDNVLVLPFDLMDSTEKLQAAAKAADEAFDGAGIDFLIHNAGEGQCSFVFALRGAVGNHQW